jgi:hypothetical protein
VTVPPNFRDHELEDYLLKIRQPRDQGLKMLQMEREADVREHESLRRATRMTREFPDDASMYATANLPPMPEWY